jgi:hypothetical protein
LCVSNCFVVEGNDLVQARSAVHLRLDYTTTASERKMPQKGSVWPFFGTIKPTVRPKLSFEAALLWRELDYNKPRPITQADSAPDQTFAPAGPDVPRQILA